MYSDTVRSAELRHEVPVSIGDAFLYAEHDGVRHIVVTALEAPRFEGLGLEFHPYDEFGLDELRRSGRSWLEIEDEITLRAVAALGIERATVPGTFPLLLADKLRAKGVELVPDQNHFVERRRVKSELELAGIRRAQAAAEAGMAAARELLRRADAGQPAGALGASVFEAAGVSSATELGRELLRRLRPDRWASLAGAVFAATSEDAGARRIVVDAAKALAGLASSLPGEGPLVLAGGLLLNHPELEQEVRSVVARRFVNVIRLEEPPVAGAVRLALQLRPAGPPPA
jgi:hypothetical protein